MNITVSTRGANLPAKYVHLDLLPVSGALGATVRGIDLRALSEEGFAELRQALNDHLVLFIEGQALSVEDQQRFSLRFGEFGDEPFVNGVSGFPKVVRLVKEAHEKSPVSYGGAWHTDWSFLDRPPSYSILYSKEVPPFGGDTLFASTRLAYETLSAEMKRMLDPLYGIHSASVFKPEASAGYFDKMESMDLKVDRDIQRYENREHPLVRTHPLTQRKALYLSPGYTVGIKGLPKWESEPLLSFLFAYCTDPLFCCRYRWSAGTLAIWDNRATLHRLIIDYLGFRREMFRTTVIGEVPS
jgi:taurine dioxygenase